MTRQDAAKIMLRKPEKATREFLQENLNLHSQPKTLREQLENPAKDSSSLDTRGAHLKVEKKNIGFDEQGLLVINNFEFSLNQLIEFERGELNFDFADEISLLRIRPFIKEGKYEQLTQLTIFDDVLQSVIDTNNVFEDYLELTTLEIKISPA